MKGRTWAAVLCTLGVSGYAWAQDIGIYVPAFRSPGSATLGLNAATVINLGIWKTLRKSPYPNPNGVSFGNAIVRWSEEPLGSTSPLEAAKSAETQLVLDGAALPYGDGAVVTTRLYVTAPTEGDLRAQTWALRIEGRELAERSLSSVTLEYDVMPERVIQFVSIPLKDAQLATFKSAGLLEVHKGNPSGPVIGRVGDNFRAVEQSGTTAKVTTDAGLDGFLILPQATPELDQVTAFTGGLVRVMRGDWGGAATLLSKVTESELAPTSLKIDALLLMAFSLDKLGKEAISYVERARALSPSAPRILQYRVMITASRMLHLRSKNNSTAARALAPVLRAAIDEVSLVSPRGDSWVSEARRASELLSSP